MYMLVDLFVSCLLVFPICSLGWWGSAAWCCLMLLCFFCCEVFLLRLTASQLICALYQTLIRWTTKPVQNCIFSVFKHNDCVCFRIYPILVGDLLPAVSREVIILSGGLVGMLEIWYAKLMKKDADEKQTKTNKQKAARWQHIITLRAITETYHGHQCIICYKYSNH